MSKSSPLPLALRQLVKDSVAELGGVIRTELGPHAFRRIERLRRRMADLRQLGANETHRALKAELKSLDKLQPRERLEIAHAYSLMLELMNACENAYRSHRIRQTLGKDAATRHGSVTFVLTAHPTEARSPGNIEIFHEVQEALIRVLDNGYARERAALRHLLHLSWKLFIARTRRPSVQDEAGHIYSIVLREETLVTLLEMNRALARIRIRSWVGGDKDGHPGVSDRTMLQSLQLSRTEILKFARRRAKEIRDAITLIRAEPRLLDSLRRFEEAMSAIVRLTSGDGARVTPLKRRLDSLGRDYLKEIGETHPSLTSLRSLCELFPAWVVPLELRESSDLILMAASDPGLAISRMLRLLAQLSRGGLATDYAAGLIISQFEEPAHFDAAQKLIARELGSSSPLPVIPLFEQASSLRNAPAVLNTLLKRRDLLKRIRSRWDGQMEIMLGYSDSSKEMGAFPSRLAVSETMRKLDAKIRSKGLVPVFFHGSGGSVDRGGGSIEEQIAAWPRSALEHYKATIQGEMVERTFASPEITRSQTGKILERFAHSRPKPISHSAHLDTFAARIQAAYQAQTGSPDFLEVVERATTYRFLSALRMGSRPTARKASSGGLKLSSLRAIPWVLGWTQTRVLFPAWWGVGSAWKASSPAERAELKRQFARDPLFRSYVKLLGFTLRKVEMPIWRVYLEESDLPAARARQVLAEFETEFTRAVDFVDALSGSSDLLWFRPWLSESITLRAPMIHPLNLLQILSLRKKELALFRAAATGISSGMLTTG